MKLFNNKYRIESVRLPEWDYSSEGAYFVTVCVKDFRPAFGTIEHGQMRLNRLGNIVEECWWSIGKHYRRVEIGEHIVMPNHVHAIIHIGPADEDATFRQMGTARSGLLSNAVGSFKSSASKWAHAHGYEAFQWQPGFYDRVVRDDNELDRICEYIKSNPAEWERTKNRHENFLE